MSLQRLAALRALMAAQPTALAAYIVPTADAHNSEYIAPADARREWLSGFTGSAGTAVVTTDRALVWTDGRYYTQFQKEADLALWTLMKQSLPDTLSMEKWLVKNLVEGSVVGADPHTMTRDEWTPLQTALSKANMQLVAIPRNLVDEARVQLNEPPPPRPRHALLPLSVKYTGKTAGQKIEELRSKMVEKKAAALVVTALDEVAYTLNLRGSDIDYNPVFFSYFVLTANTADLFWGDGVLTDEIKVNVDLVRHPQPPLVDYNPVFFSYFVLTANTADLFWGDVVLTDEIKVNVDLISHPQPPLVDYNPVFFSYFVLTANTADLFWGDGVLTDEIKVNVDLVSHPQPPLVDYNPVFFSYFVLTANTADLFWGDGVLTDEIKGHLKWEGVEITGRPYADVVGHLVAMAHELSESGDCAKSVWLSSDASEAIHRAAAGGDSIKKPLCLISEVSPVALAKLIKNEVELLGFRNCHVRDGVAVSRLLRWLHVQLDSGATVTEPQAAEKLLEFRKEEADFMGPSFETIAGAGPNGAIIHYTPSKDSPTVIKRDDMFLLDSGGQYKDGTTDITRTRHMSSSPTAAQKDAFTRVLKGQISVGSALFPQGVKGNVLDSFARKALWDVGLDYAHGTGHGVGHFLNVHEGPAGVSWRPYPHDPGLQPQQILSNEPGYYKVGEYGIRHEDLVETVNVTKDSDHPRAQHLVGDYDGRGVLGFSTLTLVPQQRACIDVALLDDFELAYLNAYHKRVLDTLGPILEARGLADDAAWLTAECASIARG